MGWGFRKSIKVAPGIRINLSKSGVSTSIGGKGFTYNTRGRVTASIPGTGIRFTQNLKGARTSRPVSSVVTGSRNLDADGSARLSKREQATQEFVQKVQERTADALVDYFFSHGVYVRAEDLSEAVTLEDHQEFLQSLSREFETTTNAIRLAVDIGSISLAEKEKAMRAVYEIEKQCSEHQGQRAELSQAASALLSAVRSFPSTPSLVTPLVIGLVGAFITYAVSLGAGIGLTAVSLLYGGTNASQYLRRRDATLVAVEAADQHFDSLLSAEVTPRPALHMGRDVVRQQALGFAGMTLVATLCAVVMHFSHPVSALADDVASADGPRSADTGASPSPAPTASPATGGFAWMVGKYPYDVVNDRRFRAAFRGVSRADWKKIAERLTVVNQAGIQLKDGFLVGDGCKAHECNSEKAAFAINESTGKGVLIMMETPDDSPVFTTYRWKELSIGQTPLADWRQQQLADSVSPAAPSSASVTTTPAAPSFAASFDCTKAHSDAEHLICGDAELAAADVELAGIYTKAKAAATDQAAFRERTRAQWIYREKTCHDRECVARWYADQKIALNEIATTGAVGP